MTDAELEAVVAEALREEAALAAGEAQPPSSAIVWWRAQMRARQEAAQLADRPITIVHGLAIASAAGFLAAVIGTATAGVKGSLVWLKGVSDSIVASAPPLASIDVRSPWFTVPMTAMLVSVVVVSIAAYFIYADE